MFPDILRKSMPISHFSLFFSIIEYPIITPLKRFQVPLSIANHLSTFQSFLLLRILLVSSWTNILKFICVFTRPISQSLVLELQRPKLYIVSPLSFNSTPFLLRKMTISSSYFPFLNIHNDTPQNIRSPIVNCRKYHLFLQIWLGSSRSYKNCQINR